MQTMLHVYRGAYMHGPGNSIVTFTACILFIVIVSLYNPAAQYERHALSRLQAVGIPVVTSIAQNHRQFCKICQLVTRKWPKKTSQFEQGEQLVSEWERANYSALTWSGLYEVLRRLELEELSQQIEEYFTSEYFCV